MVIEAQVLGVPSDKPPVFQKGGEAPVHAVVAVVGHEDEGILQPGENFPEKRHHQVGVYENHLSLPQHAGQRRFFHFQVGHGAGKTADPNRPVGQILVEPGDGIG